MERQPPSPRTQRALRFLRSRLLVVPFVRWREAVEEARRRWGMTAIASAHARRAHVRMHFVAWRVTTARLRAFRSYRRQELTLLASQYHVRRVKGRAWVALHWWARRQRTLRAACLDASARHRDDVLRRVLLVRWRPWAAQHRERRRYVDAMTRAAELHARRAVYVRVLRRRWSRWCRRCVLLRRCVALLLQWRSVGVLRAVVAAWRAWRRRRAVAVTAGAAARLSRAWRRWRAAARGMCARRHIADRLFTAQRRRFLSTLLCQRWRQWTVTRRRRRARAARVLWWRDTRLRRIVLTHMRAYVATRARRRGDLDLAAALHARVSCRRVVLQLQCVVQRRRRLLHLALHMCDRRHAATLQRLWRAAVAWWQRRRWLRWAAAVVTAGHRRRCLVATVTALRRHRRASHNRRAAARLRRRHRLLGTLVGCCRS
jgi:hypothetical protein